MKPWVLIGPTAAGKTDVGVRIAEQEPAEIVSCDSMLVYRGMDIGTAKPSPEVRARVPHHLIDVADPDEEFSVGRYVEMAHAAIADIQSRGRRPLIVGGTALYLKALLWGLFEGPPADEGLRRSLTEIAETHGNQALYDRLGAVDPDTAERIHPNDLLRIVRALEVYELTGRPISSFQNQFQGPPEMECALAGLNWPRQVLYERIEQRVHHMIEAGLIEEVRRLLSGPGLGPQAEQALGYRQIAAHLRGEMSLEEAIAETKKATRRFAKHQLTWFKHFPTLRWVQCEPGDKETLILQRVLALFQHPPQLDNGPQ